MATYNLRLDLNLTTRYYSDTIVQTAVGDKDGVVINAMLGDGFQIADISGATIEMRATAPDGVSAIQTSKVAPVDPIKGTFTCKLPTNITGKSGLISDARFRLTYPAKDGEGEIVESTSMFAIRVIPTPGMVEVNGDVFDRLDETLKQGMQAANALQRLLQTADEELKAKLITLQSDLDNYIKQCELQWQEAIKAWTSEKDKLLAKFASDEQAKLDEIERAKTEKLSAIAQEWTTAKKNYDKSLTDLEAKKTSSVNEYTTLKTKWDSDVAQALKDFETAKTTAINDFESKKTEAISDFETKKATALTDFETKKKSAIDSFAKDSKDKILDLQKQFDLKIAEWQKLVDGLNVSGIQPQIDKLKTQLAELIKGVGDFDYPTLRADVDSVMSGVGGRNYFQKNFRISSNTSNVKLEKHSDPIIFSTGESQNLSGIFFPETGAIISKIFKNKNKISVSFEAKSNIECVLKVAVVGNLTSFSKEATLTKDLTEFKFLFESETSFNPVLRFYLESKNTTIELSNLSLKSSPTYTDWTPAPEDIEQSIQDVKDYASAEFSKSFTSRGTDITPEVDWDTITNFGIYRVNNGKGPNSPLNGGGWGILEVGTYSNWMYQKYISSTFGKFKTEGIYYRVYVNGSWQSWHFLVNEKYLSDNTYTKTEIDNKLSTATDTSEIEAGLKVVSTALDKVQQIDPTKLITLTELADYAKTADIYGKDELYTKENLYAKENLYTKEEVKSLLEITANSIKREQTRVDSDITMRLLKLEEALHSSFRNVQDYATSIDERTKDK